MFATAIDWQRGIPGLVRTTPETRKEKGRDMRYGGQEWWFSDYSDEQNAQFTNDVQSV